MLLVYYFALKNEISYSDARKIIERLPETKNIPLGEIEDVIYTQQIRNEVESFTKTEELLDYINRHIAQFGYNNASGSVRIQELWKELAEENGLCEKERRILYGIDQYLTEEEKIEAERRVGDGKKSEEQMPALHLESFCRFSVYRTPIRPDGEKIVL